MVQYPCQEETPKICVQQCLFLFFFFFLKFRHSSDTVDTADPKKIQDFDISTRTYRWSCLIKVLKFVCPFYLLGPTPPHSFTFNPHASAELLFLSSHRRPPSFSGDPKGPEPLSFRYFSLSRSLSFLFVVLFFSLFFCFGFTPISVLFFKRTHLSSNSLLWSVFL